MKGLKLSSILIVIILLLSCSDNSVVEEEILFEYTNRISSDIYIGDSTSAISVENPIGFVNISSGSDSVEISYVIDKTVKVKESELAQDAFDQIRLTSYVQKDTAFCMIEAPAENNGSFKSNLSLIVPYSKPIVVKNTNGGVIFSHLYSDIYAETNIYNCEVNYHSGSLEAHSTTGQISGSISLQKEGYCNCYSESGNIHLQIPTNSSVSIHLKTVSGTITYNNLNINIISSSNTELKGLMNSGEGNIYIESISGNIILEGI